MNTIQLLQEQNRALREHVTYLEQLAYRDALTGCFNRHSYDRRLVCLQGVETFVYIDLCWLKQINDQVGHDAGDQVLTKVGGCLRSHIDEVYRVGGDELIAVLRCTPADAAQVMARVEAALTDYRIGDIPVVLAWGIGVTASEAEAAMYQHKQQCYATATR